MLALAAGFLVAAPTAVAEQCTSTGSNTYSCGGDLDQGFSVGAHVNAKTAEEVTVTGLQANIEPTGTSGSGSGTGVLWDTGTQPTTLHLLDPTYMILLDASKYTSLQGRHGAYISGFGGDGDFAGGVVAEIGMPVTTHSTQTPAIEVGTQGATDKSIGQVVVVGPATVSTTGASSPGVKVDLLGGTGNSPGDGGGKSGSAGGAGGAVKVRNDIATSSTEVWTVETNGTSSSAIDISAKGGQGGKGASNTFGTGGASGDGGTGGSILVGGGTVSAPTAPAYLNLSTNGSSSPALNAYSRGGDGNRVHAGAEEPSSTMTDPI